MYSLTAFSRRAMILLFLLAIAMTDFGNMAERRLARIVDTNLSELPPFLVSDYGLNSGYMIPQYTAAALLVPLKQRIHPFYFPGPPGFPV